MLVWPACLSTTLLANSIIETGCYLETNKGLGRAALFAAIAMVAALSGKDGI
jgi:hypothetical protein